jgi:acyl-CoA oxidase
MLKRLFRIPKQLSSLGRIMSTTATTPSANFDIERFTEEFLAQIHDVPMASDPAQSSAILRRLVKSSVLKFDDMEAAPEKFFLAHRLLSTVGLGGFGIRFTVQFNLFAGSMVGLAGPEQRQMLQDIQTKGQLGCFLLTEMQAGVLSGLIVETTADWDPATQEFILHTPSDKAAKNWISQGYTAELGVVIADLRINGKSHGPHPFFINLRDGKGECGGDLMPGIRIEDMGTKTIANDLDNARVWFDQVRLPKSSLLNKFCDVVDDEYVQVGDERMRIEVIGQRLLTGRQCIAEAALLSARVLHMKTEEYAKKKVCNGLAGETNLASMPQLRSVFEESYRQIDEMIGFTAAVEERLADCLKHGTIPDEDLVDAISVCKIRCIDVAIQRVHALRMEVGSYALMHDTGFELVDMFLCCKFAEGDSRILQQKLTRDRLKKLRDDGVMSTALKALNPMDLESTEASTALFLGQKLAPAAKDRKKMAKLMDEHWEDIYKLADQVAARHIRTQAPSSFPEEIVERLECATTEFDSEWKDKLEAWKTELQ